MRRFAVTLLIVVVLLLPVVWRTLAAVLIDLRLPGAVNVVLYGQDSNDHFGTDLAAGDINGDDIADIAVGANLSAGPNNAREGAGEVDVYYGRSVTDWSVEDVQPDIILYGAGEGNLLGGDSGLGQGPGHIAIGDLDNDGTGDLVVSAPGYGYGNSVDLRRGRVWIIWGGDDLPGEIDLAATPPELEVTTVTNASQDRQSRDYLGAALATGDFNGDGTDDVAMSAPSAEDGLGVVYVMFGGSHLRNRAVDLYAAPENVAIFRAIGERPGQITGTKLGSYLVIGDLSGDGFGDLAIGAEWDRGALGTVYVLFGSEHVGDGITWRLADTPANWRAEAEQAAGKLGSSLDVGDFNGDSHTDLLMGAPGADGPAGGDAGQAIGIVGPLEGSTVRDLDDVPGDLIIYGPQGLPEFAYLGESVTIGDFDRDGVGDVFVGARNADELARNGAGIVYMFYGGPSLVGIRDLQEMLGDITLIGAAADDRTGYVTSGDVTGDGIDDMILSANWREGPHGETDMGAVYILFGSEVPPTPMPTPTPTPTATPTPTPTPTPTATTVPPRRLYLPLILRNYIAAPG
ncbi:MAG: hypothetical protein ACE5F6_13350 [Anaerolineae bacterium]